MSHYLLFDGKFFPNDSPVISANNRGFRYADGLFETMKLKAGNIQLAGYHFERLFHGLDLYQFELPPHFTAAWLTEQVLKICRKNQHSLARIRLTVFRGNGGLYDPESHLPHFIIQTWALNQSQESLNENGLVLGIYPDAQKSMDRFARLKSSNYQPYLLAALYAKKMRWNEALVKNAADRICDATIANLFIVKDGIVSTPSLSEGCVAGVQRRFLLEALPAKGFEVQEAAITVADIYAADELFLTNAIQGIRWAQCCDDKTYTNRQTARIFKEIFSEAD
jgi:branched-chain amino acid aminotransferase